MLNAVNFRPDYTERLVWPPEAMMAELAIGYKPFLPSLFNRVLNYLPICVAITLSLFLSFFLVQYREALTQLGEWGYVGVFFFELVNSATIFFPTPGQTYAFAMGVALNPLILGVVGGTGSAIGELTGYFLGARTGSRIRRGRLFARMQALTRKWGGFCLFLFAMVPGPFEVVGLWAGTVRYPIWRFIFYVAIGKILKVTGFAVAGYFSISWLFGQ